jgi:3D (Asp-Asp-Asp) domain-containing protein
VRLLCVLAVVLLGSGSARAVEWALPRSLPPPDDVLTRASDGTKIDGRAPDKVAQRSKVKECCGYPIGPNSSFLLSFYWLAYETEFAILPYDTDIYTMRGFFIGRFPSAYVYELKMEGAGVLADGRVLNYDGKCNYGVGTCFKALSPSEHPLGAGVQGRKLEPFRSIAVDPRVIPIGATVWVPELNGALMPDGTRHDGCLRADDQGEAIKFGKIDFFVESHANHKFIADQLGCPKGGTCSATPHIEEPRCEYLRLGEMRERINEHTDYAQVHIKNLHARLSAKLKAAMLKVQRNRQKAKAWVKRHYGSGSAAQIAKQR